MRLLLTALQLVQVGELLRKEPKRQARIVNLNGFREVLPEMGNARPELPSTALGDNNRRGPQAATLRPGAIGDDSRET